MADDTAPQSSPPSMPAPPARGDVLHGPVLPTLMRLGLPMVGVLLTQIVVAVAETYWTSFLGTGALAGVALVFPVLSLMVTMSNGGIGGGVSSAIARALGAGRRDEAIALVGHALVLAVLSGAAALAGYGVASRLDWLLIPLLFGLGTAVVTMVGVATGAGRHDRARRVTWAAAIIATVVTEGIGLLACLFPHAWLGLFSDDPAVVETGARYLRVAAPTYGAVGLGMVLYFASQGQARMLWPFLAGAARLLIAAGGGWLLARQGGGPSTVGAAVAAGSLAFGAVNALGMVLAGRKYGARPAQAAPAGTGSAATSLRPARAAPTAQP